jgi:hypothetical protein
MGYSWKPLRRRGLRGRSGQVSAVATVLALMLFTSFLATFVLGVLPTQMTQQEFQHQLQVQNQIEGLQTDILEAANAWAPATVATVTVNPVWNSGNLCTTLTAVSCTGSSASNQCSPPLIYNQSVNNTVFTYVLSGSSDCMVLNILGNGNTVTLEVSGSNANYFVMTLSGFNDTIILNNQFSGSGFHAQFWFYGGYDTYEGVGGPTGSNMVLNTYFVSEPASPATCPSGNLSANDHWSITGASSSNSLQNFTWYDSVGYSTTYQTTAGWPGVGNSGSGDHIGWQNVSATVACPFLQTKTVVGTPTSVYLSAPVTLNSGSVPPFGVPSSGSLGVEPPQVGAKTTFAIASVTPAAIGWNKGTACFAAGSGTCTTGTGTEVYNFSGNHSTVSPTVAGCAVAGCNVVYNVSGNFNTLSLTLSGANIGHVAFQVSGNWDNLTVHDAGSCNIRQLVNVIFSGNNDTYTLAVTGCTTGAGANLNTTFVGSTGAFCPYGIASKYNKFLGATWGASTGIYQNFTWRNAYGLVSAPHSIPANGGLDQLTFGNTSGYYQCLFTNSANTGPYTLNFQSGVKAVLNNRYLPASTVAYDQGAVILGTQNGGSVMLSPPETSFIQDPFGITFALTLVSISSVTGTATGFGTAAAISSVQSVQTYFVTNGHNSEYLPFFDLNITTNYPQAWATFWGTQGPVDPMGTTCIPGAGVTAAQCLAPPLGRLSTIVVPINAAQFTLTSIVAHVSIY